MVNRASSICAIMSLTWILRFRNLPSGTPFDDDSFSADYNMHVEFAYTNYRHWKAKGEDK